MIFLLLLGVWLVLTYNSLVARDQNARAQWQQVENQYQRKIDLIPQLIDIVEDYQEFERSTLTNITLLRAQWQNATGFEQRINISEQIDQQIAVVRSTYENYPYLASIEVVEDLFFELAGTENRIAVERGRYNDAVRDYNTAVHSFPGNLVAGGWGFRDHKYYDPFPGGP